MKNLILIIALSSIQAACTAPGGVIEPPGALLGFGELAGEISVACRDLSVDSRGRADVEKVLGTP